MNQALIKKCSKFAESIKKLPIEEQKKEVEKLDLEMLTALYIGLNYELKTN